VNAGALALVRAEFIKLRSTRTALGLFIGAVAVAVVPAIVAMSVMPRTMLEDNGASIAAAFGLSVVPMLAVVFGILGMTNEYRHGTITYTYLQTPRRWVVVAVKLLCYGLVGAGVMAFTGLAVAFIVYVGAGLRSVTLTTGTGGTLDGLLTAGNITLFIATVGLMTAFGVGLGALLRAQVPTVAGVLVWALIIEPTIAALKPGVGRYLPFEAFQQVTTSGAGRSVDVATDALTRPQAFLVSLAYIAAVSVAAVYLSLRRDVT
jgi:ABC-2 type transport system permease protein